MSDSDVGYSYSFPRSKEDLFREDFVKVFIKFTTKS